MEKPTFSRTASRDSLPLPSAFPTPGKQRKSSSGSVSFAKQKKKNKARTTNFNSQHRIKGKGKEETKLQAKQSASLASKLKTVARRLETRTERVEEEAERAKENLHLHFTTLEAALCRTLREREAQLAAEINNSADYRCRSLLQLRNEAATLSHKLHVGGDPSEREELVERAKKCHSLSKRQASSKQRVELVLDGALVRRLEQSLRSHGIVDERI